MSVFFVFHTNKSVGPTFNEAASILKGNKNIMMLDMTPVPEIFTIEAREAVVNDVKKSLPGWDFKSLKQPKK